MSDNKLRCALVYRIEAGGGSAGDGNGVDGIAMRDMGTTTSSSSSSTSVTMLAKYDHASQYETHAGTSLDEGTLYGGRDKSYADAVALVIKNGPPSGISESGVIGGFKVVQSDAHQVVFGADMDGLCLAVITGLKYPSRVAIQMLTELYKPYSEQFALLVKSGTVNSLSKKSKPLLSSTCKKYDDLSKVDKASHLIGKVDEVKVSMQDNIASLLKNTEQAENLAEKSDQLTEQANVFKKNTTVLKNQMRCKNLKMTIIIALLVVGILAIIILPLILRATDD